MSARKTTLQQVGIITMIAGGTLGGVMVVISNQNTFLAQIGIGTILFSEGFGLLLSGVGDLRDREATLATLNARANLDASGKILLGNGLMLSAIPVVMPIPLEDNKLLLSGIALLTVAGSACLGVAQDKGKLIWK
jgi:hypothetical protein